jgi:iron(III) transport system substrate-binding protein
VTTDTLSQVDPSIAELQKSKLLGTTDASNMDQMLTLAKEIFH